MKMQNAIQKFQWFFRYLKLFLNPTIEYFGVCPECLKSDDEYLNIGRVHFFVCHEHKICWIPGANHFSSWKDQDNETFRKNEELLRGYDCIEPYHPGDRMWPVISFFHRLKTRFKKSEDLLF